MKILLSNKFYYPKGGDCIHAIELERLLRNHGHEVAFFAMHHPRNLISKYSPYFPSEVDYSGRNFKNLMEQILRPVYSNEVRKKFRLLLEDFKPDIVHVHNIHSQLSPIIVREAWKRKIPVIWTIHDYKLLCPRYDCRRDDKPCELCFKDKKNVIRYRCLKNSLSASFLAYLETLIWCRERLSKYTAQFICPSEFIRQKMISGGFDQNKLVTLNNFFMTENSPSAREKRDPYYCYIGRLSKEKGVETLLKAATELPQFHLKVVGTGPLYSEFIKKYDFPHIEYYGHMSKAEVLEIFSGAIFSIMPSEGYENNPLAVIESLSLGIPVLGARTGGIPELISDGLNGILFESGSVPDLSEKIRFMFEKGEEMFNQNEILEQAIRKFDPECYMERLSEIYNNVCT